VSTSANGSGVHEKGGERDYRDSNPGRSPGPAPRRRLPALRLPAPPGLLHPPAAGRQHHEEEAVQELRKDGDDVREAGVIGRTGCGLNPDLKKNSKKATKKVLDIHGCECMITWW